jgi:hypothetical protein
MMIPLVATVTIGHDSTYWIPLAIVWILLMPFTLLLLPLALFRINPFRTIAVLWQILTASKGTDFELEACGKSLQVSVL